MGVIRRTAARVPGVRWLHGVLVTTPGTWIFQDHRVAWLRESDSVSEFPLLYRAFAAWCRVAPRMKGRVVGAENLHRLASFATRTLGLRDHARVEVAGKAIHIRLTDARSLIVPLELARSKHLDVLRRHLRPGDTFVDIGANHGSFSVAAAERVGAEGRVVAFEPQPGLAELVRRSLGETRTPFEVHEMALSDRAGEAEFFVPRASSGIAGLNAAWSGRSGGTSLRVPLARLEEAVDWEIFPGSVFVKLDVEGAEASVLRGARRFLVARRPRILMEVNPGAAAEGSGSFEEIAALLADAGYTAVQRVPGGEPGPLQDADWSAWGDVLIS